MIKEIREHYGIPQKLFADYLGITRSHLSMAEIGKRSIATYSQFTLLPFYLAISEPMSKSKSKDERLNNELANQKERLKKIITNRQKENEYKLQLLGKSLSKMKEDQARCLKILGSLESLRAKVRPHDMGLITIIEYNIRELQSKTGENSQFKLELKIQNLQAEILYLKNRS